jgi:hypothetical protein
MLLGYIIPQTNTFNPLQALSHLQNLNYYFSELGFLTIESETVQRSEGVYFFSLNAYSEIISSIKLYGNNLMNDYNSWSYCPSSRIVTEKIIPIWTSSSPNRIIYENLVDVVQSTLTNVKAP